MHSLALLTKSKNFNLISNVLLSDEVSSHECEKINRHNCLEKARSQMNRLNDRYSLKANVWLGPTQAKVYDPFFFEEPTVTGTTRACLDTFLNQCYLQILDTEVS